MAYFRSPFGFFGLFCLVSARFKVFLLVSGCFGLFYVVLARFRFPFGSFWLVFGSFCVYFFACFGLFWLVLARF